MSTQKEKAEAFQNLHVKGSPLILFNCWDAGSARTIEQAGAKAIATSSWAVAAANGFEDGEKTDFELALTNLQRIVKSVSLPVTMDLEGGYATDLSRLKANIEKVIAAGAAGINFEDQIIGGEGLYSIEDQSARIEAVREVADKASIPLFINARTDVFLKTYPAKHDEVQMEEAVRRGAAYTRAGARAVCSGLERSGVDPKAVRALKYSGEHNGTSQYSAVENIGRVGCRSDQLWRSALPRDVRSAEGSSTKSPPAWLMMKIYPAFRRCKPHSPALTEACFWNY